MKHAEFKEQLDRLRDVITRGLTHYAVWKKIRLRDPGSVDWSLEQQNQILDRFRGFLTPVAIALLDMTLIEFVKVFDTDSKTASLTNLLSSARQDPMLVPHASTEDLRKISSDVKGYKLLLANLRRKRSQQLVHVDANPDPVDPILTADFDRLADWVESAFNTLARGHDQSYFSWQHMLRTSENQAAEVFGILLEEMKRQQQKYDADMVQIGVDQLQRAEADLGHSLDKETMGHVIGTLGLTEEQMQRAEEKYQTTNQGVKS